MEINHQAEIEKDWNILLMAICIMFICAGVPVYFARYDLKHAFREHDFQDAGLMNLLREKRDALREELRILTDERARMDRSLFINNSESTIVENVVDSVTHGSIIEPHSAQRHDPFTFSWDHGGLCTDEVQKRLEKCQNNGKAGVGWHCFDHEKCGGNGDRLGGMLMIFLKALDICVPFTFEWDTFGAWDKTSTSYNQPSTIIRSSLMNDYKGTVSRGHSKWFSNTRAVSYRANVKFRDDAWNRKNFLIDSDGWYGDFLPETALGCLARFALNPSATLQTSVENELQKMKDHAERMGFTKIMGIHWRVGDDCIVRKKSDGGEAWRYMLACAQGFAMTLYKTQEEVLYFFASDCKNAKESVKAYLGDQVYITGIDPKHTDWEGNSKIHIDAWTEMLLLSNADSLTLGPYSGYGTTAQNVGFIPDSRRFQCWWKEGTRI